MQAAGGALAGCDCEQTYLYHAHVTTARATYTAVPYAYEPVLGSRSKRLEIYTGRYAAPYWGRHYHRPGYSYCGPRRPRYYGHDYGARRFASYPRGHHGRRR